MAHEHVFVRYGFTLTEHDADKPWLVLNCEHRTIDVSDGDEFFEWALQKWPADRFTVQVDPWALNPAP